MDDIFVRGQRRQPDGSFPPGAGSGGGKGDDGWPHQDHEEPPPYHPDEDVSHPCADPATALDWNADAAAADLTKDLRAFARSNHPTESDFNEREYGAALWERPNGTVIPGPMRYSDQTFAEAAAAAASGGTGKPFVAVDWTPPEPGVVLIGSVHSHGSGGTTPSGHRNPPNGDVAHLLGIAANREFQLGVGRGSEARIYIASNGPGHYEIPGDTIIHVYDQTNIDAAISGQEGPEVNPDAQPCGAA